MEEGNNFLEQRKIQTNTVIELLRTIAHRPEFTDEWAVLIEDLDSVIILQKYTYKYE